MDYWETDIENKNLHTEYIDLLRKYGNLNIELIKYSSWSSGYTSVLKGEDAFGILNLSWSKEREKESFDYLPAYGFLYTYLIVRDDNTEVKKLRDLENKTVAIKQRDINYKYLKSLDYDIVIDDGFDSYRETYKVLFQKKSNVEGVVSYTKDPDLLKKYKLKIADEFYTKYGEIHLGVNKNYKVLSSILNTVSSSIPKSEFTRIQTKLYKSNRLNLTPEEQAWIDKKIPIKYAFDSDWAPFEWASHEGKHQGIFADLITTISQKTGIVFEAVQAPSWKSALKLAKTKQVDMLEGLGERGEQKKFMNFTQNTLYKTPYVFTVHKDNQRDYFDTFDSLVGDEKVAVIEDSTIHKIIEEQYPDINPILLKLTQEGFSKLSNKEIDIYIVNASSAKYYINNKGYDNLKTAARTEVFLELKSAIRNDWPPEVVSILDKAIQSFTKQELKDIYLKWTKVNVQKKADYEFLYKIIAGVFICILMFIFFKREVKKSVNLKTSQLQRTLASFDDNVILSKTDVKGTLTYVSKAFCNISGYSQKELVGSPQNIIRHSDMSKELFRELWRTISDGQIWKGEIKNRKKDGSFYWIDIIIIPEVDDQDNIIEYTAIGQIISSKEI